MNLHHGLPYTIMNDQCDRRRANFIAWMKRRETTVSKVARAASIPRPSLYSYTRGDVSALKGVTEAKIAQAHGETVQAIFEGDGPRVARVMGRIGAAAVVFPFDELDEPMYTVDLPPNIDNSEEFIAFEVQGISMPPAKPGWVVLFRNKPVAIENLLGFPCMVDLANGQRLFKEVRKGYSPGRFNLVSWDGTDPMEDQEIVRALPLAAITPGRMRR